MDWTYVKIRSWHIARPRDYAATAYCGKSLEGRTETSPDLAGTHGEKTCESCLTATRKIEEHHAKAKPDAEGILTHDPSAA